MALTTQLLLCLVQFLQVFVFHTRANDYAWPNEIKSTKGYTEWSGGIVTEYHRLRADQSPYFILNNVIVEDTGQLIIDPGVTLKFSPKTGITVKGSIVANVTILFLSIVHSNNIMHGQMYVFIYIFFRDMHITKL